MDEFDSQKLLNNAIASIRMGVEDFKSANDGDEERSLSAARNLYAGVLQLFKYRLAMKIDDGSKLLFKARPVRRGRGFTYEVDPGKQSIDFEEIKSLFKEFEVDTDWVVMGQVRKERNNIEHLHPRQSVGVMNKFLYQLFPLIERFVREELNDSPATLLSRAWDEMISHQEFFDSQRKECLKAWESCVHRKAVSFTEQLECEACCSPLVMPDARSSDCQVHMNHGYVCKQCGNEGRSETLFYLLLELIDSRDPFDSDSLPSECACCGLSAFSYSKNLCLVCGYELKFATCAHCETQIVPDSGQLCDRCAEIEHVAAYHGQL